MKRKMESLIDDKIWKLVEYPTDQTLIDSKWVYKLKYNQGEDEARIFKARLMARDFTQEKGVNYNEVFSQVAKYATTHMVNDETFNLIIFVLYADDMLILAKNQSDVDECKTQCPTDVVEKGNMSCVPYEQAVCSLMYLMVCTRPDIAFAMSKVMDSRVKHIDIKYHFIRQAVSDKTIELVKIDGTQSS
ncbi:hypothetical protein AXG93_1860s1450 [Marchantia polymorpha subsp. ruderalis]|uniref:Reverse transcriptase Ty1/copia-type domain-containing protein n=1 Tax=Marchantia polymorpha subsp. ruderalis TaxID=1480154 RepID=A0A176VHE0_MARPO|nr:hypothetical protein AXG93_1860s1450 [Marchantia polymorpha subsp. ruderalis]